MVAEPLWKTVWQFLIQFNMHLPCDPREMKAYVHTKTCAECFRHHSLLLETTCDFLNRGADEQSHNLWHTCPHNKLKGTKPLLQMHNSWWERILIYFVKRKKPDTEGSILYDSTHMTSWERQKYKRMENKPVVATYWGGGVSLLITKGHRARNILGWWRCSLSWLWEGPTQLCAFIKT